MARKKNLFENMVLLNKKTANALEYLLKKAPEENVISGLRAMRSKLLEEDKKKKKLPRTLAKIESLLLEYPGFQKALLNTLNSRIKRAKEKGIIHKYAPKVPAKKAVGEKGRKTIKPVVKEKSVERSSALLAEILKEPVEKQPKEKVDAESTVGPAHIPKEKIDTAFGDRTEEKRETLEKDSVKERDLSALKELLHGVIEPEPEQVKETNDIIPSNELEERIDILSQGSLEEKSIKTTREEFAQMNRRSVFEELGESADTAKVDAPQEGPGLPPEGPAYAVENKPPQDELPEVEKSTIPEEFDKTAEMSLAELSEKILDQPREDNLTENYIPHEKPVQTGDETVSDKFGKTAEISLENQPEMVSEQPQESRLDIIKEQTLEEEPAGKSSNVLPETVEINAPEKPEENDKATPKKEKLKEQIYEESRKIFNEKTGILSRDEFLTKTVRIDTKDMKPLMEDDE